jgi:23S rRNA (cytidine1920-2'-O)/16S rRNA (cytidine1409-2'-O)-methyltransferase
MKRLDLLLLEKGLASTRTKAQDLIAGGKVSVNGRVVTRAGEKFTADIVPLVSEPEHPYVSRGGVKLEAALRVFRIPVAGARAFDVGQSAGGFTDCLLRHGASAVVGVDVGTAQLAPLLREDVRVAALEKQDIRTLAPERVAPPFGLFVVDVSFLSLGHVLPVLPRFLSAGAEGVVLVKPQFEVGPSAVGSGGIVRDAAAREGAVRHVRLLCEENGFTVAGEIPSPVSGGDGNLEVLLHLRRNGKQASQGTSF